jgi:hypothetical protein
LIIFDPNVATDQVAKDSLPAEGHLESDDRDSAFCLSVGSLLGGQLPTKTVIAWLFPKSLLLCAQVLESFGAAVTPVGVASFHELLGVFLVQGQPLGLKVRAIGTTDFWPFIPVEAQPAQALKMVR